MRFQKLQSQLTYSNFGNFDNSDFQVDKKACKCDKDDKNSLKEKILLVFNKYTPVKKKWVWGNEAPFVTKNLHKEIMKCQDLKNMYLQSKRLTDWNKTTIYRVIFVRNFHKPPKRNIPIISNSRWW